MSCVSTELNTDGKFIAEPSSLSLDISRPLRHHDPFQRIVRCDMLPSEYELHKIELCVVIDEL